MNDPLPDAKRPVGAPAAGVGVKRPAVASGLRVVWESYALAAAATVTTLMARLAFNPWTADRLVMIVFLVPIALSAYLGGLGPGLAATLLAAIGTGYFVVPPVHSFQFEHGIDLVQWIILVLTGVLISALSEALHRANRRVAAQAGISESRSPWAADSRRWRQAQMSRELVRIALRTSLVYGLFAAVWILVSDRALVVMVPDPEVMGTLASYKGLAFVAVTTTLLYGVLSRQLRRWRAEAEARAQAEETVGRFEILVSHSQDSILLVRGDDGQILEANPAAMQAYGFTRDELLSRTIHDLRAPDAAAMAAVQMADADAHGILFETMHRHKDGRTFPVEVSSQGVTMSGTRALISVVRDITERHRIAEALRMSEERFRQVAENIHEGFWLTNVSKSRMLYVSPAYERITGRTCESLYQDPSSWLEAVHPGDRSRVGLAARTKQATGGYYEEYRVLRPDGAVRWLSERAFPVRDAGGAVYRIAGVVEDITERRKLEEQFRQARKLEEVGQLAAGITHDFNNVLTVVQMNVSLLEKASGLAPEVMGSVREISDAARRAANLTRQLLTFSRRQVMQLDNLDLNRVVADMSRMLERILGENIRFEAKYASVGLPMYADSGMIEQVLMNLSVNARDAMPNGGRLVIETAPLDLDEAAARRMPQARPGAFARLAVSDTGVGIPPENLPRIFEPFFTTKDVGQGTGLGMATVHGIVHQHRGWIEVVSEVGRGTTFLIYLPRQVMPVAESRPPLPVAPAGRGGGETILLVEDEVSVRMLVQTVLEQFGYRVVEATTGATALEAWKAHRHEIRLLLTDYLMPDGMTGLELARTLSRESPELRVILTSGYSPGIALQDPASNPDIVFLPKPFEVGRLIDTVRSCLDTPRAAR
jgi:two-component system, cell cycle sensor histidine kinase and response regulator CckA